MDREEERGGANRHLQPHRQYRSERAFNRQNTYQYNASVCRQPRVTAVTGEGGERGEECEETLRHVAASDL